MGNGQDHFLTTGKIASVPTATHNNNSWRAWAVQSWEHLFPPIWSQFESREQLSFKGGPK